jgi:7-carboxy-7-deazaguanine synthase
MRHRLSEKHFKSVQGEGARTGALSVWTRFTGCNLSCPGFLQKDPRDASSYVDPMNGVDPKSIKRVEDFPVVKVGCDTLYGIDPKFKHLSEDYTTDEIVEEILSILPFRSFEHPKTFQTYDWCITGGEPLLWQKNIIEVYRNLAARLKEPYDIQIETNGTKELSKDLCSLIDETFSITDWHFSISPKLYSVSGEPNERAWKPDAIRQIYENSNNGWLKFVVNDSDACWKELEEKTAELVDMEVAFPIFVMPVGATFEQQTDHERLGKIARRAIDNGYHVSGRLHAVLFGNSIGS